MIPKKVLYLLKCKVCGEVPYVGKAKTKFRYKFDKYKSKHRAFRKDTSGRGETLSYNGL